MIKKLTALISVLLFAAVLEADVQPFRSGIILGAELTSQKQTIRNFDEIEYPDLPQQNRVFASVTLKLFNSRPLSRHDYSIRAFGNTYKCVALKVDDGPWVSADSSVDYPEKNKKYSMLFILDGLVVGLNDKEQLDIRCNYPPAKYADTPVTFNNRRTQNFTRVSAIPANGILTVKK